MNKSIFFGALFLTMGTTTPACYSQIDFQFSYLTDATENDRVNYFFDIKDIDDDGDLDIVSSSFFGKTINWYENIDGLGEFGDVMIVDDIEVGSYSIQGVDFDGDDDIDILASLNSNSSFNNSIVWYENVNGEGEFSLRKILYENNEVFRKVLAKDIEDDGDLDIIFIVGNTPSTCHVLLNEDGLYTPSQLSETEGNFWDFIFEDVNNDDNKDIITIGSKNISIIENTGNGEFSPEYKIYDVDYGVSIKAYDLDNDNDMDLVASMFFDSIIVLNNLGSLNFELGDVFYPGPGANSDVYGINVNNDPYIDLCVGTTGGFHVIENSGVITDFSKETTFFGSNDFSPYKIIVSDINLDSKEDVIGCWIGGTNFGLYSNLTMLTSFENQNENEWELYVSADQLHVNPLLKIEHIRIYNSAGQLAYNSIYTENIDVSFLLNGIYFYQLIGDNITNSGQFILVR